MQSKHVLADRGSWQATCTTTCVDGKPHTRTVAIPSPPTIGCAYGGPREMDLTKNANPGSGFKNPVTCAGDSYRGEESGSAHTASTAQTRASAHMDLCYQLPPCRVDYPTISTALNVQFPERPTTITTCRHIRQTAGNRITRPEELATIRIERILQLGTTNNHTTQGNAAL